MNTNSAKDTPVKMFEWVVILSVLAGAVFLTAIIHNSGFWVAVLPATFFFGVIFKLDTLAKKEKKNNNLLLVRRANLRTLWAPTILVLLWGLLSFLRFDLSPLTIYNHNTGELAEVGRVVWVSPSQSVVKFTEPDDSTEEYYFNCRENRGNEFVYREGEGYKIKILLNFDYYNRAELLNYFYPIISERVEERWFWFESFKFTADRLACDLLADYHRQNLEAQHLLVNKNLGPQNRQHLKIQLEEGFEAVLVANKIDDIVDVVVDSIYVEISF